MSTRKLKDPEVKSVKSRKTVSSSVKKSVTRKSTPKTDVWPKVVKGSHLTVTTYENGKADLVWDYDQLLKEVRSAIASVESKS